MQRFGRGLVFEARRLLYHSTLGVRVIKKKNLAQVPARAGQHGQPQFWGGSVKVNQRSEKHRFGLDVRVGGTQSLQVQGESLNPNP